MRTPVPATPFILARIGDADSAAIGPNGDDDPEPEPPAPATALVEMWWEAATVCTACASLAAA